MRTRTPRGKSCPHLLFFSVLFDGHSGCGRFKPFGGSFDGKHARSLGRTGDGGSSTAEQLHLRILERQQTRRVAVGPGFVCACACHGEFNHLVGIGHRIAVAVEGFDGEVHQLVAVGSYRVAVRSDTERGRLTGGAHGLFCGGIACLIIGHDLDLARLIHHIVPAEAVAVYDNAVVLGTASLALAVDKEFGRRIRCVYEYGSHLAFASGPCPVRKHMQGLVGLVPFGTVKIVAVLGKRREVDYAEVGAVAGPCIGIVGRRFAKVVEAGPYELADDPGTVVVHLEVEVGNIAP